MRDSETGQAVKQGTIRKSKRIAAADPVRCVACGTCERVCPRQVARVYKGCYAKIDLDLCVGCGKCAKFCPACCIEMKERADA